MRKEEVKYPLFKDNMSVYIKLSGIYKMLVELRSVLTCLQDTI